FISVSLDVARIDCFQLYWRLNLANFPARWQFPFQFCGKTGVARERPVGMPPRSHPKQQTDSEWFPGNNGVRISKQLGLDEFFSLINLHPALRPQRQDMQSNQVRPYSRCQSHIIT